ncbi:MAG: nicotinate phosphoribosyltransferase [Clostridia bacterium]|nr:nicotinate phosphoribosyltransferase [Clostridia bacterium]
MKTIQNGQEIAAYSVEASERLFSADGQEIREGWTTDIYFVKTRQILRHLNLDRSLVTAEIFARRNGILAGVDEVKNLLKDCGVEVWALPEGSSFAEKEVLMRITGAYDDFGLFETPILGMLASSSGWATASRECKEAAGDKLMICFGARHVHPAVAPVMERAAVIGGADGCSCILGAKLLKREPSGTVPHTVFLVVGDSVKVAQSYQELIGEPVIVLVDTFKDEIEESLRVAEALGQHLNAVRLDTPSERGGVTPALVREARARLDQAGYSHVQILVSGGLTPDRIRILSEAGAASFGVGSYISGASAIDMTMDLKEVNGLPLAKRGRIPGITPNEHLERIL